MVTQQLFAQVLVDIQRSQYATLITKTAYFLAGTVIKYQKCYISSFEAIGLLVLEIKIFKDFQLKWASHVLVVFCRTGICQT